MDLTPTTSPIPTLTTALDTPTPSNHTKSLPFTNGSSKSYHPTQPSQHGVVSYKECLKNHAASIGGHALDGCGEFMPSPASNPTDPTSLKCAACGCHRNFHRRHPQESNPNYLNRLYPSPPPLPHRGLSPSSSPSPSPSPSLPSPISSPSPPPVSHYPPSYRSSAPQMLLALGTAYSTGPSQSHEEPQRGFNLTLMKNENPSGKKRSRTKFSQEQKEKMLLFSEKLGWKMSKDDRSVQEFCREIGVCKGVFKVWMHNNKQNLKKRSDQTLGSDSHKTNIVDDHCNDASKVSHAFNINSISGGNNNEIHSRRDA